MAEMWVIGFSKKGKTPASDRLCYKRGMTIDVEDDGWPWTETERGEGYVLIELPGVPKTMLQHFLEPIYKEQTVNNPAFPRPVTVRPAYRKRKLVIDLDRLNSIKGSLGDTSIRNRARIRLLERITIELVGP